MLVPVAAPSVSAAHGSDLGIVAGTTATMEDDGAVVRGPGHVFDGRENRVVPVGSSIGDGSLFLDMRLRNSNYPTEAGISSGSILGSLIGRPDLLMPGYQHGEAWYGWWNDLDGDRTIDDIHDEACGGPACAGDEFVWRGISSGESPTMTISRLPSNTTIPQRAPVFDYHVWDRVTDETDRSGPHQTWRTSLTIGYTESLIASKTLVTYTNAREVIGGARGFPLDPNDPDALVDVDVHEALSPDVETLWWASMSLVGVVSDSSKDPASVIPDLPYPVHPPPVDLPVSPWTVANPTPILAYVVGTGATVQQGGQAQPPPVASPPLPPLPGPTPTSVLAQVVGEATRTVNLLGLEDPSTVATRANTILNGFTTPPYSKEPNTWEDDYGQHALFGGEGDTLGSYNDYGGYLAGRHLWIDNRADVARCAGTDADILGMGVRATAVGHCLVVTTPYEPFGGITHGSRSSGATVRFEMHVGRWQDLNGDTHVGEYCEPNEFDAQRNTCVKQQPTSWPHAWSKEIVKACVGSSARNGRIILTPINDAWPNVVVVRDSRYLDANDLQSIHVRDDTAPIELRFDTNCVMSGDFDQGNIFSRDTLYFPEGPSVAVHVRTEVVSAEYLDATTGVIIPSERVVDVDILPAGM